MGKFIEGNLNSDGGANDRNVIPWTLGCQCKCVYVCVRVRVRV